VLGRESGLKKTLAGGPRTTKGQDVDEGHPVAGPGALPKEPVSGEVPESKDSSHEGQ